MRDYQRVRPGTIKDPATRATIEHIDRWLMQASPWLKNVITTVLPGAVPLGNSSGGGGGSIAVLPDHNHSRSGQGGNTLGDSTTQMEAFGNWYFSDKIGIQNIVPTGRLHIGIGSGTVDLGVLAILQACASQTSDLLQTRDSASAVKGVINASHQMALGRSAPRARMDLTAASAYEIGLYVQAASSQSANLIECHNSSGGITGFRAASQGHVGINANPSDSVCLAAALSATVTSGVKLMDFVGTITDNTGGFEHKGVNSILTLQGTGDFSIFEQIGFQSIVDYKGSNGATPLVTGAWFIANKSGTGPVDTLTAAVFAGSITNSGDVVQYYGNYISNPSRATAALLDCTGILIEVINAGVANYSIKSLGGLMYHAGKIGINQDPPTAMLHLTCDASATIGIKARRSGSGSTGDLIQCLSQTSVKLSGFDAKGRLATPVDGSTTPIFNDITTTTKLLGIDASGITAATTRYWKALDVSGTSVIAGDQAPAVSAGRMGKVDATAQAAAIAATNLTNGAKVGYYLVHYTIEDTTADVTAGTIQFQVGYTDDIGATTQVGAALILTATGRDRGVFQVYLASGELSYQTNLVGIIATSRYALRVRVEFLG